jgi:hypothetical protein
LSVVSFKGRPSVEYIALVAEAVDCNLCGGCDVMDERAAAVAVAVARGVDVRCSPLLLAVFNVLNVPLGTIPAV